MKWFDDFKREMGLSPELCEQIEKIDEKAKIEEARMLEERIQIDRDIKEFYHNTLKYQSNITKSSSSSSSNNKSPPTIIPTTPFSNNSPFNNNSKHSSLGSLNQTPSPNLNIPTWLQPENIPSHPPIHEVLDFTRKLSELKKCFMNHRTYLNRTYMQVFKLLNPRQQAHLILKAYDKGPSKHREALEFTVNIWKSVTNQDPASLKYVTMLMSGSSSSSTSTYH